MQFTQPIFLWALAGLSIPIMIHLLSKKEGKVIRMGSLRHLRESSTQQFKSIKLNELFLLLLRCVLIILFVFLISGLHWAEKASQRWLIIESGITKNPEASNWIDSLKAQGYELHWLVNGFPKKEPIIEQNLNYWEILAGLKQLQINEGIVFSFSELEHFKGKRESMPKNIRWITFSTPPHDYAALVFKKSINDYIVRTGSSTYNNTYFLTRHLIKPPAGDIQVSDLPKLKVIISYDINFQHDAVLLKSMLSTISEVLPIEISVAESQPERYKASTCDWLFWLSTKSKPLVDSTKVVAYGFNNTQELLYQVNSHYWCLSQRISLDKIQKENILIKLALLLSDDQTLSQTALENDSRVLPDSILFAGNSSNFIKSNKEDTKINSILLITFLFLLIFERILSIRKRI